MTSNPQTTTASARRRCREVLATGLPTRRLPTRRLPTRRLLAVGWLAVGLLATSGCGSEPPLARVSGQVIAPDDRPLDGLLVTYLPDPDRATLGGHASGLTDASGRYVLAYRGTANRSGSVVGWHKVVIEDYAAENSRQRRRSPLPRVPPRYRLAATTPLEVQIHPGEQTVDLELED
ncbi:hypothetical protein [Candidatus Laterigemmans baculatus]|uniref:hypothetical protein n=1 Tax=Candidatus Laterigemmans baculatus TaxID=2770505 RepID=UPI0013D9AA2F|nr:hypothetical protein [Candidatus Laterigemmans baculatus]